MAMRDRAKNKKGPYSVWTMEPHMCFQLCIIRSHNSRTNLTQETAYHVPWPRPAYS
jgi:hypothetical protein